MTENRDRRVQQLKNARAADSAARRRRAIEAVAALQDAGVRVTFSAVAREARVSTWLVYNAPDVRQATEASIAHQAKHGYAPAALARRRSQQQPVSDLSLRTDLALARQQISKLTEDNAALRQRLQATLGAELDSVGRSDLIARIQELESQCRVLAVEIDSERARARQLAAQVEALTEENDGTREALRRIMKERNAKPL